MSVYFKGSPLSNTDPGSFSVLGSSYAKDRTALYYAGALVRKADPATFQVVDDVNGTLGYDAKDRSHTYYYYGELNK